MIYAFHGSIQNHLKSDIPIVFPICLPRCWQLGVYSLMQLSHWTELILPVDTSKLLTRPATSPARPRSVTTYRPGASGLQHQVADVVGVGEGSSSPLAGVRQRPLGVLRLKLRHADHSCHNRPSWQPRLW